MKSKTNKRHIIQLIAAIIINGYAAGFVKGKIFTGKTKLICVPVLNCYSCPGALGSCPIGGLQAVLGDRSFKFSFYILGFIMLFGILCGRLICGFLCPFGFVQDLLYKIRRPKFTVPKNIDKPLRYLKYFVLIVFVIALPLIITNQYGMGNPYFCKLICPAGTLEGGIPLLAMNEELKNTIGALFFWKLGVLLAIIIFSIITYRPFCKYLCPLGALYALFNKFSFYQMDVDKTKCTGCKICERNCKMNVEITKNINSTECIRCSECKNICPHNAISSGFKK
ncbi:MULTISPECIES: 4Fe-4S binding protein [unclassified Sedimentibacter]|uniref:4Fe-4S binding protein n=1 Tax=unclassified Sedimentibacter TaxID=2649220 RepID=UPI0027DEB1DC|nr:4Fe-4S binding protein [Sedimentibacter sp. MB35-C1]WMJ77081.1 4Fe-4S binding protein [Sedimentibacter sp. MB35-C1]